MKKLYLIGGTMGVGKSTISQKLNNELNNSVFLDGDWCWNASPFQVTNETKAMVMDNICYLLNSFIKCSAYDNIIFCWVMHEQSIIDEILEKLDTNNCKVYCISLMANQSNLTERLSKDIKSGKRTADIIERSVSRIQLYEKLNTIKIDTNEKTIEMVIDEIKKL